jgi:fatty-acyl-CoA synthase
MWIDALAATAEIDRHPRRLLSTVIADFARSQPGATALIGDEGELDYAGLERRIGQYARLSLEKGIGRDDVAALLMPNCLDYPAAWLGVAGAGSSCALLNTNLRGEALAHCLQLARPRVVIVAPQLRPALATAVPHLSPDLRSHLQIIDPPAANVAGLEQTASHATIEDTALLIYTSGTTGLPKAAKVSHRRILNWALWFKGMLGATPSDRMYDCLPLYHSVGGVVAVGSMFAAGGSVAVARKFSASGFWADVAGFDCTLFQYIGELCRYLLNAPETRDETRHRIRAAVGNGLSGEIWERFKTRFALPQILEFYASTEGNVSLYNAEGRPGSIGRIPPYLAHRFPTAVVKFDPDTTMPARGDNGLCIRTGRNEPGETLGRISGTARFEGYTEDDESERKIVRNVFSRGDAWFRTGDLMRVDEQGFHYFVDRIGDTFRWKGENVSTAEVAAAIRSCPDILDAVVYGVRVPHADGRAGMAKLVVHCAFDVNALQATLREALPLYAMPVFLRVGAALETTETFKHKKQELAKEGFDPRVIADPLFVADARTGRYVALDTTLFQAILEGDFRL